MGTHREDCMSSVVWGQNLIAFRVSAFTSTPKLWPAEAVADALRLRASWRWSQTRRYQHRMHVQLEPGPRGRVHQFWINLLVAGLPCSCEGVPRRSTLPNCDTDLSSLAQAAHRQSSHGAVDTSMGSKTWGSTQKCWQPKHDTLAASRR